MKQAVVTVTTAIDYQKLLAALKNAGFGGSVADVHIATSGPVAEGASESKPDETAAPPPLPGLSVDEPPSGATGTTYSSNSFSQHVQVSAYLDHDVLHPGDLFRVAIVLDIDDGWHVYGNPLGPGIGVETLVSAQGPADFTFEPARYAPAHRLEQDFGEAGKTWVWEHSGKTIHFLSGRVGDAVETGKYQLTVEVAAQVCTSSACLPGKATIVLSATAVPNGVPSNATNDDLFAGFDEARLPSASGSGQ